MAVLLVFQIISNGLVLCRYLWVYMFGSATNVTEEQRRLMAISVNGKVYVTFWDWARVGPTCKINVLELCERFESLLCWNVSSSPDFASQYFILIFQNLLCCKKNCRSGSENLF